MATPRTAFRPSMAATVNIDVSSSSGNVSLANGAASTQVRVFNDGTATAWVNFGPTGVTAAVATGIPVGPGVTEVMTIEGSTSTLFAAAIAAGSTGKIYFTPGIGL